tara:strand:+ start:330 stop:1355 length:1026 start_codon:yes stop_codon:yes gene_type:complete
MFEVSAVSLDSHDRIQAVIDNKTKPKGALGQLEDIAAIMASILGDERIVISNPTIVVFAGDHGIAQENISIAPPEVTQQMVQNFLTGGAAINVFCRGNGLALEVVNAGILGKIDHRDLIDQSLGNGTQNFVVGNAMDKDTVAKGLELGRAVAHRHAEGGSNVIGFGEMGIGNTASASALLGLTLNLPAVECVGRGTGINDMTFYKKQELIGRALTKHYAAKSPIARLAAVGGFEIVQIVGAMIGAAEKKMVVLVDGFIASVAALMAYEICAPAKDYMIFCHKSEEQAHQLILDHLVEKPILDLGLRLGEGTGAALAYPMIKAAADFYNDMATFESAGVTGV